jgi:predicted RNase H-like HicB family nuclease
MDFPAKQNLTFKVLLHKEPEGTYTVSVPKLPGCITYGDTVEHAISMAKEAISLYIADLRDKGEIIPDDSETLEYSMNITTG